MVSSPILRVESLRVAFGGLTPVNDVSFGIEEGSITGLIGPNGSGKTTLFNLVTGVLHPDAGDVWLGDQRITGWQPHRITERGLARTFQISRVFGGMTVWENMLVVGLGSRQSARSAHERAEELLNLVHLWDLRDAWGADLSYGQQKLLEFARLLMLEPRVLLLDEPFAGVNPTMIQTILSLLRRFQEEGRTIFVIDHAMTIIMGLCQRLLVMDMGELIADRPPDTIQADERVLEAYFGRSAATSLARPGRESG